MDYPTQFSDRYDQSLSVQQELDLNAWLDAIRPAEPIVKTCADCQNYVSPRTFANGVKAWGHCSLKTGDGWEATSLEPWSRKAVSCRWFAWLQEF